MSAQRFVTTTGATALALACVLWAAPAAAQVMGPTAPTRPTPQRPTTPPVRRPAPNTGGPSFRAYYSFEMTEVAATKTFDAIFEKTRLEAHGFGGEVTGLWKGLFARVATSSMREEGTRVIVVDGRAIPLGIPLRLKLRPLEFGGGWRFGRGRIVPYVGGGLLQMSYDESSDFADASENTKTSYSGQNVFGGIEVRVAPWVIAGVEAQYRRLPKALGDSGAAAAFGESDLGGTTVKVLLGIRP